jgi:hypothetical protein
MKAKQVMEKKKYGIRILMQSGTTQQWLTEYVEAEYFSTGGNGMSGYYYFKVDGKGKYYPMTQTIVEEL